MAGFGRMEFVVQDSSGNALSGVSVEVRRQGAQVNGAHAGAQTVFNVDDPGAIVDGDTVSINTGSVTRVVAVGGVTATTITVGGAGFSNAADDDRLTIAGALPTLYNDTVGNETRANPLTTDSTGQTFCYLLGGKYDVLVSGGGATTRLYQDMACNGGETLRSNIYSGTAWNLDTLRSMSATDLLLALQSAGVTKFSIAGDGEIAAGAAGATHTLTGTLTTSGALTVQAGGAAVTGAVSATTSMSAGTTVTAATGLVATTGGINVTGTSTFNSSSVTGVTTLTRQRAAESVVQTLTDLSTTPSVATGTVFAENNSGATSITNFTSGAVGQVIYIIFNTANTTIVDGATIQLAGGANFVGSSNDVLTLVQWLGTWYEVARSVN